MAVKTYRKSGSKNPAAMGVKRIRITAGNVAVAGVPRSPGDELEVSESTADYMISNGLGDLLTETPVEEPPVEEVGEETQSEETD